MSQPESERPGRPKFAAPALVALGFGLFELLALVAGGDLRWNHTSHTPVLLALTVLLIGSHGTVALVLDRLLARVSRRARLTGWLIIAGLFGWGWQDSVMHGDGIRAFVYYDAVRVIGSIVGPLAVAGFVCLLGFVERVPLTMRRVVAAVTVIAGAAASQLVLTAYDAFHGYLALLTAGTAVWLLGPLLTRRVIGFAGVALFIASTAAIVVAPNWASGQRATQRFSEIPAGLLALPWTNALKLPPESVLDPDATLSSQGIATLRRSFKRWGSDLSGRPRGDNVLLIVLESTRADSWEDPKIAPRFHKWKRHGLYVPRAVAQYPATPLAYGAMFTSQPPSVLTQTPAWAKSRLFDVLSQRFDHLILTRPDNPWFDRDAITDFFVPRDAEVLRHASAGDGLQNVKARLAAIEPDDSFFGWIHLYEPHQPWNLRPEFARGKKGRRGAYESEVALVDDRLGEFMEWFYEQPHASETLVILIADHGEGMGERIAGKPYWGHHVHVRNVVSHVPAFFSGPGVPTDSVRDLPIAQLDVMPTMFDFLGEELPEETYPQGRSVFAVLDAPDEPRDLITEAFSIRGAEFFDFVQQVRDSEGDEARARFAEVTSAGKYAPKIALQYGRYKLIRDMLLQDTELFDIIEDPDEKVDLAKERPEEFERLQKRLTAWRAQQSWVVGELERR